MMSLDEDKSAQIFALMDDEEIKELSVIMASLGKVNSNVVEQLFQEFAEKSSNTGTLIGTFESTERLLSKTLDKDRVSAIMEEISGPAGRTMWDKLGNVNEHVLANYLKTNIRRRLRLFSLKLRQNMPRRLSPCCRRTLRWKLSCACCGWIRCRKRCWTVWKKPCARSSCPTCPNRRAAIPTSLSPTFSTRWTAIPKVVLWKLWKNATAKAPSASNRLCLRLKIWFVSILRAFRFCCASRQGQAGNRSQRRFRNHQGSVLQQYVFPRRQIIKEDMEAMGPVRLRDVEEAQQYIVTTTKELSNAGEIVISEGKDNDELIY